MGVTIPVEMGETKLTSNRTDRLLAFGLGACVGLCLYDAEFTIAVMVHVVLPQTLPPPPHRPNQPPPIVLPGKFADSAVKHAIAEITRLGGKRKNLCAAIAGGARIYTPPTATPATENSATTRLEIGPRNIIAVKKALDYEDIPLLKEEVGGHCGRTMTFHVGSGDIFVREIGTEERFLVNMSKPIIKETLPRKGGSRVGA
jgi:chemotaxis protein CheD